jgi:signal transduction histidine kinase/DNA-binding response OmpR family regulator
MQAGADDYLVKPFSARELFARVDTHVRLSALRRQAARAIAESEQRLASELTAMSRLHALSSRLLSADDLNAALDDVLENAIAACGADFGNIQLLNARTNALEIAVQRGFQSDFLDHFSIVRVEDDSACARAMRSGERIAIEDVELDPAYELHRSAASAANYRAVQSTPLRSHHGGVVGMLSTHYITPHKLSEQNARLLDLYARHAADFIERVRAESALKEADVRKDEFLAVLAHELRNPLAPLRHGIEIARLTLTADAPLQRTVEMMDRQLSHLIRLVDDLLDVNRISRGKVDLKLRRLVLADVLTHSIESCRSLIEAQQHKLEVAVLDDRVMVDGDADRLSQVFSNLISNSAKYTSPGGRIQVTLKRDGAMAVVSISDNGIGITDEHLDRIFEMFVQVHAEQSPKPGGGLGIGLYLVRQLVTMHGGTVEAASGGVGAGSTFTVKLPIAATAELPDMRIAARTRDVHPRPRRILVVDDNADAADSLAHILRLAGHQVTTANNGLEAVQHARQNALDVIFMDVGMPGIDGVEAAKRIRSLPGHRNTRIVALTGWGHDHDRERTKAAGMDMHLVKPVEFEAINALLAELEGARRDTAAKTNNVTPRI